MMRFKFLLLLLTSCLYSLCQDSTLQKTFSNHVDTSTSFTTSLKQSIRNAVFDSENGRVHAVTTQDANAPYNFVYWTREAKDSTQTGFFSVPASESCDLVIGDNGNKILYAYRGSGFIDFHVYSFSSSNYSLDTSASIAPVIFNPPVEVMQYAGPELCIDQNDNVVVFYRSIDGVAPGSDVIHHFAKAGDIHGNWSTYSNRFNALVVTRSLALPTKYATGKGDVGMTKYASDNMVNFVFPVEGVNGKNFLYHAQLPFNKVSSGDSSAIKLMVLDSSTTDQFIYPSIDGANTLHSPSIVDDWIAAYDHIHGVNDIKIAHGSNGSFQLSNDLSTILPLSRQMGFPDIHYIDGGIGLSFSNNDTVNCKDSWDPLFLKLDLNSPFNSPYALVRLNSDSRLPGDQKATSLSVPINLSAPYISYYDESSREIVSAEISTTFPCNSQIGLEENTNSPAHKVILKTQLYSLDGRLIKSFNGSDNTNIPRNRLLIQVHYFSDGTSAKSKVYLPE